MRIDKENKNRLQAMAMRAIGGLPATRATYCVWTTDESAPKTQVDALGYEMKIQSRRRTPQGRVRRDPAPTDSTRKITWVLLEENPFTRSRYWIGIPRDIAEKALVFGYLPSLEETEPVRITH